MAAGLSISLQVSPYERSQIPYRLYCEYQFTPASGVTRFCTGLVPCF